MAHSGDKLDVVGEEAVENEISSSSDNPRVGELKRQDTFVMENTSTKDGASSDIAEARSTEAPEERRRDEVTTSKDEGRIECPVLNSNSPAENVDSKSAEEVQQKDDSPLQDATAESRSSVDVNPGDEQVGEEDEEHQELEQSIIRDSNFTGVEDNEELSVTPAPCESEGNRKSVELEETVVEVGDEEQQDSEQSSDTSVTGVEGCIDPNKSKAVASESPDVPEDVTQNDENPLVVSAYQCDSEEGKISNQCEAAESHSPAKSPHTPEKDKSFEDSSAQLEPEEANISDQGDTTNIDKFSAIDNSSDIPEVTSETTESLDSTVIQSTTEHILVDEGYSETSDSDYHSSGKDVKVPSIVEGLGINEVEKDSKITVNLASQSEELITQSRTILDDIVEEDEDYSEIKSVVQSKDDVEELKLAVSDEASEIVSTNGTNVEAAVDEQENTDHSGFASPLRLAVSPEPSNNVEDDSPSKVEIACPALKSPAKDVADSVTVSHVDKESKENIDTTTVLGKLGLRKHVEFSQTNEICEGENEQDDECGPEIYENDTTSVGDTDEEKRDEATSKNNEDSHCKGEDVKEMEKVSQENGHEIYENDTDSDGGNDDADEPVVTYSGANFIDDEAEEGEETEDESDDENIIYDETEESDSSDSDVELLDQSNFILDEAKERRLSFKKPSHDSVVILDVTSHEANDGSDDESSKEKAGRVDFDESCYIVEEPTGNEQPIRTSPESKISPKADKPVFEISEIADSGKTVAQKVNEFASGAASQFVTERTKGEPLKSIFKTSKGFKNANAYASAAASQFVVSEDAIKQKHEKKPLKAKGSASTGSPKSDSSDQENTNRAPKTKKRPAAETEAEALKEKKKSRLDNTVPGFCVKLCNVAPNTHIDVLREALGKFGIASGLQSLEFCPTSDKRKKTAIAIYNSKKNLEKALSNYGKVVVQGRRIFFLLDDETVPAGDQNQLNTASPKKSPRKKFVGIIGNLAENITIGDICSAYEEEGIKFLNKVKLYKMRSSKDNFAQLEFSKKTALLKAIIVTEKIRIKGNKIVLKIKEKPTAAP
uniref:RRM domain-containing protein n=1 Tax=Lygus hesperus TaxID=30085 RepID=A0A0A9YRG0_LYGHE